MVSFSSFEMLLRVDFEGRSPYFEARSGRSEGRGGFRLCRGEARFPRAGGAKPLRESAERG